MEGLGRLSIKKPVPKDNEELSNLFLTIKSRIGNINRIREKITAEPKPNLNEKNDIGNTPLIDAAYEGSLEVVTALLEAGANPNIVGNDDGTALDWAASKGRTEIVKKLAEYGAKMTSFFDSWIGHLDDEKQEELQRAFAEGQKAARSSSAGGSRTRRHLQRKIQGLHKLPKRHRLRTRRRHANRRSKRNRH
jgi:ankyrin repeat protein